MGLAASCSESERNSRIGSFSEKMITLFGQINDQGDSKHEFSFRQLTFAISSLSNAVQCFPGSYDEIVKGVLGYRHEWKHFQANSVALQDETKRIGDLREALDRQMKQIMERRFVREQSKEEALNLLKHIVLMHQSVLTRLENDFMNDLKQNSFRIDTLQKRIAEQQIRVTHTIDLLGRLGDSRKRLTAEMHDLGGNDKRMGKNKTGLSKFSMLRTESTDTLCYKILDLEERLALYERLGVPTLSEMQTRIDQLQTECKEKNRIINNLNECLRRGEAQLARLKTETGNNLTSRSSRKRDLSIMLLEPKQPQRTSQLLVSDMTSHLHSREGTARKLQARRLQNSCLRTRQSGKSINDSREISFPTMETSQIVARDRAESLIGNSQPLETNGKKYERFIDQFQAGNKSEKKTIVEKERLVQDGLERAKFIKEIRELEIALFNSSLAAEDNMRKIQNCSWKNKTMLADIEGKVQGIYSQFNEIRAKYSQIGLTVCQLDIILDEMKEAENNCAKAATGVDQGQQTEWEETKPNLNFQTTILNAEQQKWLIELLEKQVKTKVRFFNLKMVASHHEFSTASYHRACDKLTNHLTVIRTARGFCVGGFSSLPLGAEGPDPACFLFSATRRLCMPLKPGRRGTLRDPAFGPIFGSESDLRVDERGVFSNYHIYLSSFEKVEVEGVSQRALMLGDVTDSLSEYEIFTVQFVGEQ